MRWRQRLLRASRSRLLASFGAGLLLLSSCQGEPSSDGLVAEFGVFFGGQVQQLVEIPFELDVARQRQGFRLVKKVAPTASLEVRWELSTARTGRTFVDALGRRGQRNTVRYGQDKWRPEEVRFEKELPFLAGDPLGMWNIRVLLEGEVVLDRPFTVYNSRKRR